jgi:hypothetical protein
MPGGKRLRGPNALLQLLCKTIKVHTRPPSMPV